MQTLRRLERLRTEFGAEAARAKLACLRALERSPLPSAAAVRRLHEALCFVAAYPDDAAVLAQARRMLAGFARRRDLRRSAAELAETGIAGTELRYPYFADTAAWLARRHPRELGIDWELVDDPLEQRVLDRLDLLLAYGESLGLDGDAQEDFSLR